MSVFRVEKTKNYTIMSNHHLKSLQISLKAKGLLSQMLSLPEEWDYTLKGLAIINRESIDAIREAIRELERAGYIVRHRERNEKGQLKGADYVIYEQPQIPSTEAPSAPMSVHPTQTKPTLDFPTLENPTQLITNISRTKEPSTESILSYPEVVSKLAEASRDGSDGMDDLVSDAPITDMQTATLYRDLVKENIEYDCIKPQYGQERLDEVVDIMVETLCSSRSSIVVAGDDYPTALVKSKLLRLNSAHIAYVFECLDRNTTYIRNIRKYLLTTLFNAPSTIDSYYAALVNHHTYPHKTDTS